MPKNSGFSLINVLQKTFSEISLLSDHYFNHYDHSYHYHYHHHGHYYHYRHSYHYHHRCYHYNDYHQ